MPDYESDRFSPPAPVIHCTVIGPTGVSVDGVPLLIDTGADVSVVPFPIANAVGAKAAAASAIQFLDGADTAWPQAELRVDVLRFQFRGMFLLGPASYGILGRNVLNHLILTLDGPRLLWSIGQRSSEVTR